MREIKFRAWNKEENFMDSAWLIDWEHRNVCHSKHNQSDLDDCVLMQYTEIKDKNGKEIYEGDIVQNLRGRKNRVYWDQEILAWNCESLDGRKGYLMLSDVDAISTLEVIGNIYENPDLLK